MRGLGRRGAVRRFNAEPRRSGGTLRTLRPQYLAEALEPRRLLAVSPIGPEFRVNSTTANRQDAAAVAADADGDFVVAWASIGTDGDRNVFAQRYTAGGAALGGEFRVNTFTANNQSAPSVAMDADGDFVVAWHSLNQDGGAYGVYAQRYNAAGDTVGGEFRVNTTTNNNQAAPAVAMDSAGDFVVAWAAYGQDASGAAVYAQRYTADGVAVGTEFRVNTFQAGNQRLPAAAMDADGDFVIVWQSGGQDGSADGVYAQRYTAAGDPAGGETPVNSTTAGAQDTPAVAMNANGDFVVVWQSFGQDGSGGGIYAQRYAAFGVVVAPEFRVNAFPTGNQLAPAIAADAAGDFVIAWQSDGQDGSGAGIYARPLSAGGLGSELPVNTFTTSEQTFPAVAVDADGDFVVAWQSFNQDGSSYGIYTQRFDESTETAGPVVGDVFAGGNRLAPGERLVHAVPQLVVTFSENLSTVGGAGGAGSATNPTSYRLTKGGVDISSQITSVGLGLNPATRKYEATLSLSAPLTGDADYVLTARQVLRDPAGNALDGNLDGTPGGDYTIAFSIRPPVNVGPEFRANTRTNDSQDLASVAMDDDGDFVIAWTDFGGDGFTLGVFAQRYTAAGAAAGPEFQVNTYTTDRQLSPSVAMDADGDFIIAWSSFGQDGAQEGVYAQRYNAAGAAAGPELPVNTTTAGQQFSPSVAMDAAGNFVVAWQSGGQDGSGGGIYARRYAAGGAPLGGEFPVNTFTTGTQGSPAVAMSAGGDFVVAWESQGQDGSANGIYAQRYSASGAAVGVEFGVNTVTSGDQFAPSAAMDDDGDFVVAWTTPDDSGFDVKARRFTASGVALGPEFPVNTFTPDRQVLPSAAMDDDGDFIVTWSSAYQDGSDPPSFGIYAQRYSAAGAAAGPEFRVNTYTPDGQQFPAAATDADGDLVVAWQSLGQDGSSLGVYAQRYAANERPTTLGIASVTVEQGEPASVFDLFAAFADSTDPDSALTYSVVGITNTALISRAGIVIRPPTDGTLTLEYNPAATGTSRVTLRATDTGGLFVETSFDVTVNPAPLRVSGAEFVYQSPPHRLRVTFNRPVDPASVQPGDLTFQALAPPPVILAASAVVYDPATRTATFTLAQAGQPYLANGNYRATLAAGAVSDASGGALADGSVTNFFVLTGDVNRDRMVNGTDFAILAGNFGRTGRTYAQGDLNGDGNVNGSDFALLAGNFGRTVPAPAAVVVLPSPSATVERSAAPTRVHAGKQPRRNVRWRAGEARGIRAVKRAIG